MEDYGNNISNTGERSRSNRPFTVHRFSKDLLMYLGSFDNIGGRIVSSDWRNKTNWSGR